MIVDVFVVAWWALVVFVAVVFALVEELGFWLGSRFGRGPRRPR